VGCIHLGALLEFDGIGAGVDGCVNHLFGDVEVAVVVDADFGNDVGWVPITDFAAAKLHFTGHGLSPWVLS
jgi:hypothetical protein